MHLYTGRDADDGKARAHRIVDVARGAVASGEEDQGDPGLDHRRRDRLGILGRTRAGLDMAGNPGVEAGGPCRLGPHLVRRRANRDTIVKVRANSTKRRCGARRRLGAGPKGAGAGNDLGAVGSLEANRATQARDRVDDQP